MSDHIALLPGTLNDLPVGMWEIVPCGRYRFALEGPALIDFIRRCIHKLMDAGTKPVIKTNKPNIWELQTQYGRNKHEVAEAVIQEWLRQGAPTPEPWDGVWFGLPWSYLPRQEAVRKVLSEYWDPIGVIGIPEAITEYDSYVPAITQMVIAGKSTSDLARHLIGIEVNLMGLRPDHDRARVVAAKLRNLQF